MSASHLPQPSDNAPSTGAPRRWLWLVILLLLMWGLLVIRLGAPWFGLQEAPRLWIAAAVRNHHVYGLSGTGGMVVRNFEFSDRADFNFYSHHPPTVIWLPYALTRVFGQNELALRYGFAAITLIGAAAFYVLVRRLHGERLAWWATAFYGLSPMIAYYGRVAGHDPLGMTVVMLYGALLVNWLRQPRRDRLLLLILLAWLAVWTAWPAVILVGTLGLGAMWLGDWRHRLAVPLLGVVCVLGFVSLMAYYQSQWDGAIDSISDAFGFRASNLSDDRDSEPFTALAFVWQTVAHVMVFATPGLTLMAAWGVWPLLRRGSRTAVVFWWGLLAGGLIYQLIFRNASYVHDYYKFNLIPALAIAAAAAWVFLRHDPSVRRWARPLLDSLLLLAIISGGALLIWLHATGSRPQLPPLIDALNAHVTPADALATHLTGRDQAWPLMYYTSRVILEDTTYAEAQALARSHEGRVIYIDCADAEDSAPIHADDTIIPTGACRLIVIPN